MTRLTTLILALASLTVSARAENFEGTVTYETQASGQTQAVTMMVKGDKMAFTPEGIPGGGRVILDFGANQGFLVMDSQRMYIPVSLDAAMAMAPKNADKVTFERTGENREILGYEAERVRFTDEEGTYDAWITEELGTFAPMKGPMASLVPAGFREAFPEGAFLLAVEPVSGSSARGTMRATAVEKKDLPDTTFSVPAGYNAMNVPGGMKIPGLGGGN